MGTLSVLFSTKFNFTLIEWEILKEWTENAEKVKEKEIDKKEKNVYELELSRVSIQRGEFCGKNTSFLFAILWLKLIFCLYCPKVDHFYSLRILQMNKN